MFSTPPSTPPRSPIAKRSITPTEKINETKINIIYKS